MGRKKGTLNKTKEEKEVYLKSLVEKPKRSRGRPRKIEQKPEHSPGQPEEVKTLPVILSGSYKQLKQEIRQLKKLKLTCRAGSQERIELHRKIKALKKQLELIPIDLKETKIVIANNKKEHIISEAEQEAQTLLFKPLSAGQTEAQGCIYEAYCRNQIEHTGKNKACQNPPHCINMLMGECKYIIK